jgi:hypothetical protein
MKTYFDIPDGINIPEERKKRNAHNASWILNNIAFKNEPGPKFDHVVAQAKAAMKEFAENQRAERNNRVL